MTLQSFHGPYYNWIIHICGTLIETYSSKFGSEIPRKIDTRPTRIAVVSIGVLLHFESILSGLWPRTGKVAPDDDVADNFLSETFETILKSALKPAMTNSNPRHLKTKDCNSKPAKRPHSLPTLTISSIKFYVQHPLRHSPYWKRLTWTHRS